MNRMDKPSATGTDKAARNAVVVAVFLAILMTMALIYFLLQGLADNLRLMGSLVALIVIAVAAAWFSYKKYVRLSMIMIIATFLILIIINQFSSAGDGLINGLMAVVVTAGISVPTLSGKWLNRTLAVGIVIGALVVFIDLFGPAGRTVYVYTIFDYALIAILIGVLLLFIVRGFKNYSLRGKLTLSQIIVTGVALVAVGGFFLVNIRDSLQTQVTEKQLTDVVARVTGIDTFLTNANSDTLFLSQSTALISYLAAVDAAADPAVVAAARASLEAEFVAFAQTRLIYDQIRFLDTAGQEIARVNTSLDGESSIVATADLQNKGDRYYFQNSIDLRQGEVYISPLDLNVEGGQIELPHKPMIRYATPVIFNGQTHGVIVANVLAEIFLAPLDSSATVTFLIDADGYYLYHPDQSKRWGRDLESGITVFQDLPQLAPSLTSGETGSFNTTEQLFTFSPITLPGEESPRWHLVNFGSLADALSPVTRAVQTGTIVLAVILMIAMAVSVFVSRLISIPVSGLTRTVERLAAGDLQATAAVRSTDEIGVLAASFNSMAEKMQQNVNSLQQQARAVETSAEVSRRLSTILDPGQLTTAVVEQLQAAFNYYHAHIYLLDEAGENLVMAGGTGEAGQAMLADGHQIPVGRGLVGRAAAAKTAVLVPDVSQEEGWLPNRLLPDTKAEAAVPIILGEQVLGVLDVQQNEVDSLSQADVDLLEAVANQVAIGLQNASLFTSVQEEQERAQTVLESLITPVVISGIADGIVSYVNEPLAETIRLPRAELIGEVTPDFYANPADRAPFLAAIREHGFVDDYELYLKRGDGDTFWALVSARVIKYQGQPAILTSLIDIDERKQAAATLAKQANEMATVAQVGTTTATILEPTELLQAVVDLAKSRFGLYHVHIHLLHENIDTLVLTAGAGEVGRQMVAEGRHIPLAAEGSLVATVARNRQGAIRNYDTPGAGFLPHPLLMETRSEMAIPLLLGEEVLGVLDVRADTFNYFSEADMQIQTTLATQIAVALQNARSFAQAQQALQELDMITRRLTREGWEGYLETVESDLNYTYGSPSDDNDGDAAAEAEDRLSIPLSVQGETIGQLTLAEPQAMTDEVANIVSEVAERLSAHIENLRLVEQTEAALATTARLYDSGRRLNTSGDDLQEALAAVVEANPIPLVDRVVMFLFERDRQGEMQGIQAVANWHNGTPMMPPTAVGTTYAREAMAALGLLLSPKPIAFNDIQNDPQIDPTTVAILKQLKIRSLAVIPLWVDERQLGCLLVETEKLYHFRASEVQAYAAMAGQLAVAVDRNLLLDKTEVRAQQERILREVSDRVYAAVDAESVLRTAAQELSRTLGLEAFVYLDDNIGNGQARQLEGNGETS